MKKAYVGAVAVTAGILAFSAAPAIAATDSGTVSCGSVAKVSVRGEQQLVSNTLTNRVNGDKLFQGANLVYKVSYSNYFGTRPWSAKSNSLLFSGSYGFCTPYEG